MQKGLILSDVTASAGLGLGLANIYTILGIVLVVLNICILLFNFICRMRDRLKDGKLTNEEKAESAKEILELTEKIKELKYELDSKENNNDRN